MIVRVQCKLDGLFWLLMEEMKFSREHIPTDFVKVSFHCLIIQLFFFLLKFDQVLTNPFIALC